MECEPTAKFETESTAELLVKFAAPSEVVPSWNVTMPVATPANAGCIAAERITVWPKTAGFTLDDTATALEAAFTLCARPADVLPVRYALPP